MSSPDQRPAGPFGGSSVEDNIDRAVAAGSLLRDDDGTLYLPTGRRGVSAWINVENGPPLECGFLTEVVFKAAYNRTAAPYGCRECYKVKVSLRTLRQLVAAWKLATGMPCLSKWGIDLHNPYSQDVYAGYFYTAGLDAARVMQGVARQAMDAEPSLGPSVPIAIKRGCSSFEAAVGPSDRYEFTPEMAELEARLRASFRPGKRAPSTPVETLRRWIATAFEVGDDTYLDFTQGRRLYPASVTYSPEG